MSRYYDPVTHRFLNADGYFQSGDNILDTNMNAYCNNNPIMNSDPTGESCRKHACYYVGSCEAVILICKIEKKQTGICSKGLFGGFKKSVVIGNQEKILEKVPKIDNLQGLENIIKLILMVKNIVEFQKAMDLNAMIQLL